MRVSAKRYNATEKGACPRRYMRIIMKQHYEKIITLCCFLFLFVNLGMPSTSFSVYQPYIVGLIGDVNASFVLSVRTLCSLLVMLFVDRYYALLDVRRGVGIASALTVVGFAIFSFAQTAPVFFIGAAFAGFGYGLGGMVAMTLLISRWYKSGLGEAVGIATVGSGVAAIVLPFIASRLIEGVSLSAAFIVEAAIGAVVTVAIIALTRNRPSDLGLEPCDPAAAAGASESEKPAGKKPGRRAPRIDRAPLPRFARLLFYFAMAIVGAICTGGAVYFSVLMTTNGIDAIFAATMISLFGICLTVSKFVMGEMFDRIGTGKGSLIAFVVVVVGEVCACSMGLGVYGIAVAMVILLGFGMAIGSVGLSVWSLEMSDAHTGTKFIKNCNVGYAIGSFIMNTIPGPIKNITGTYVTSYEILLVLSIVAGIIVVGMYKRYRSA